MDEKQDIKKLVEEYSRLRQGALSWIVYILQCADGTLYTGITNDVERRMSEHEAGQGAKYTKGRGPFQLVYNEICKDRGFASKREIEIKSLNKDQKLRLISRHATVRAASTEVDHREGDQRNEI